jgi:NAD(P)-dependent dehydrogenase (short-subunit alcohol dehydrogenase family)
MTLTGKKALVMGDGRGTGPEIVRQLAGASATAVVAYRASRSDVILAESVVTRRDRT